MYDDLRKHLENMNPRDYNDFHLFVERKII